jgi:hypothetical protein
MTGGDDWAGWISISGVYNPLGKNGRLGFGVCKNT